jgi:hypothetical protein
MRSLTVKNTAHFILIGVIFLSSQAHAWPTFKNFFSTLGLGSSRAAAIGTFEGSYYSDRNFGTLAATRTDSVIDFDWGTGSPMPGMPADNFSVRWIGDFNFDTAGSYSFSTTADDGVRIYVEGNLIIDRWFDQGPTNYKADINLAAGAHRIQMDYYENGGGAVAKLSWSQSNSVPHGSFVGYYFNGRNFGTLAATRNDASINFDWGTGSPINGVGVDDFSVRWEGDFDFANSTVYNFNATADDGIRVYVDGNLVLDKWVDQGPTLYPFSLNLSAGTHRIRVDYYENGGGAVAKLSWAQAGEAPIPNGSFLGSYFSDMGFGTLVSTRNDAAINFDWGPNAPFPGMPADHFSVRWIGDFNFNNPGSYRFTTTADDGVRVYVDGNLIVDKWFDQGPTTYTSDVNLTSGVHRIRMDYYENAGGATAQLSWAATSAPSGAMIPGIIQAEDFDNGGEGVGYHDTDAANNGNANYRPGTGVDIRTTADGGYAVGWIADGEWLKYSVQVATSGNYIARVRTASIIQTGRMHLEIDGADVTGQFIMPATSSYETFVTYELPAFPLSAGPHKLKLVADTGGFDLNYISFVPEKNIPAVAGTADVLTNRFDNSRSGVNAKESVLTTSNIDSAKFGKIMTRLVDGQMYAQTLVVSNLAFPGRGTHNALFASTMHNSVYAYDADTPSNRLPFWKVNLGPSVPVSDWGASYRDIDFEVGILSTPVIDRVSNTLFVVTATKEPAGYFHKLHALDLMTGQEKAGSPVVIQGSVAGSGQGSVNGRIDFNSERHLQRTGLLLVNGQVVIAFASHGDQTPYHGWIFAYDSATLTQTGITNTSPNSGGCGIWQAGTGLSADAQGGIYLVTGNGIGADATRPDDRSESVVKYNLTAGGFNIADWFTPFDWQTLDDQDADLGSDGPLVVPGTNLLLTGSKSGKFYLLVA